MDAHRFDALTRAFATPSSRRRFLTGVAAVIGISRVKVGDATSCRGAGGVCREHGNCCSGVCLPPNRTGRTFCAKSLGEPATSGSECASGIVADGVCCNNACTGQCEACNLRGAAGTCSPVTGAPVGGRTACGGSGACQGFCDGGNRTGCAFPSASITCSTPTCDSGSGQATVYTCNGAGTCNPSSTSCGLYVCGQSSCKTSCGSDDDCIGAAYCNGGVCTSDRGLGQSCDRRDQCQSGACVNGVCCSTASCPECQSCAAGGGSCAADTSLNNTTCSTGTCQNGTCGCSADQKLCGAECIGLLACCDDNDCGLDAVCQRATCNRSTHTCDVANADTDPRCVTDACTTRSCLNGVCNAVGVISVCGICETRISPCNPAFGPQCAPKVCNSPGPCQDGPGVCDPTKLGCVYTNRCAECQICDVANNLCRDNCARGVDCAPFGYCNTSTNICDYQSMCGKCAYCSPGGECLPYPDGAIGDGGACCDGYASYACLDYFNKPGRCPIQYIDNDGYQSTCCGTVIGKNCCDGINVDGHCCPEGTREVCRGFNGPVCCDHACHCPAGLNSCVCT